MKNDTPRRNRGSAMSNAVSGWELLRADRGIVLVLALLVMLVLSVLGSAFLFLSGTETMISRNSTVVTQAFYAAEAGVETALNQIPTTDAIASAVDPNGNIVFQTGQLQMGLPPPPPPPIGVLGASPSPPVGYNLASFSFNMYRIDVSGAVLWPSGLPRSIVALEVGTTLGAPLAATGYN